MTLLQKSRGKALPALAITSSIGAPLISMAPSPRRTRSGSRAAVEAAKPCFTNLPEELQYAVMEQLTTKLSVFGHVSVYSDVGAIATLGCCNRALHALSLRGALWKSIRFPYFLGCNMTDVRLTKLLERVDGRNHVESISLTNCWQVNGTGLLPLVGSTVLKRLDLRREDIELGQVKRRMLTPQLSNLLQPMLSTSPPQLTSLRAMQRDYHIHIKPLLTTPSAHLTLTHNGYRPCHRCCEVMYDPAIEDDEVHACAVFCGERVQRRICAGDSRPRT